MDRGSADLTSDEATSDGATTTSPDAAAAPAAMLGFDGPDDTSEDRRRGRRALWMSIGLLIALIAVAAVTIAYFAKPKPGTVAAPSHVAGLTLDKQSNASDTANYLQSAVAAGMNLDSSVGAVYSDGSGDSHSVIFVGGTTTAGSSSARLKSLFSLLDDGTDGVANVTAEPAGKLGGLINCATTTDSNVADAAAPDAMAVCGWADGSTVGLALFPNRPIPEAAGLFGQMRPALETHK
jgi:hypothetical protein